MRDDRQYRPSDKEQFMNERQREYFREKLVSWRQDVLNEAKRPLQPLRTELNQSDIIDRASSEADRALELRARERQRKLISKIDAALARLDEGTYGFCEETGEPIALSRLETQVYRPELHYMRGPGPKWYEKHQGRIENEPDIARHR